MVESINDGWKTWGTIEDKGRFFTLQTLLYKQIGVHTHLIEKLGEANNPPRDKAIMGYHLFTG